MNIKRLVYISVITALICLVAAGAIWIILGQFKEHRKGGPGTKIIDPGKFTKDNYYEMPRNPEVAVKPLSELLNGRSKGERRIVIEKSKRILTVYVGSDRVKSYFMSLGLHPKGKKTGMYDGKTPEGGYYVCLRNPNSDYNKSVLISYPNSQDAADGLKSGLIDKKTYNQISAALARKQEPPQETALGGYICIHGGGIGEVTSDLTHARIVDWTLGCIALRNEDIGEVYEFAELGTIVVIQP